MTKEELEKKFNEIAENHYKTSGHVPTEWAVINFKAGFDSAVNLLLPRLDEAEKREIHLENCVEQLYDIIDLSDFVTKRDSDMAVKIYNEAEIVVRNEKKNE